MGKWDKNDEKMEINWLKAPFFIAHFNSNNDVNYEGLRELRKTQQINKLLKNRS